MPSAFRCLEHRSVNERIQQHARCPRPPRLRRPVSSRISSPTRCRRACPKTSCASFRRAKASRSGCSSGGSPRIGTGEPRRRRSGRTCTFRRSISNRSRISRRRNSRKIARSRSTKSIPNCCAPTKSSAFRCTNRSRSRASRSTRCSTAFRSAPRSRRSWPKPAWCSVRSPKPCTNIRNSCRSTSAASCRCATTSTQRSIRRSSATARSSTSRKACVARWNCRRTSASTRRTPVSSNAR